MSGFDGLKVTYAVRGGEAESEEKRFTCDSPKRDTFHMFMGQCPSCDSFVPLEPYKVSIAGYHMLLKDYSLY